MVLRVAAGCFICFGLTACQLKPFDKANVVSIAANPPGADLQITGTESVKRSKVVVTTRSFLNGLFKFERSQTTDDNQEVITEYALAKAIPVYLKDDSLLYRFDCTLRVDGNRPATELVHSEENVAELQKQANGLDFHLPDFVSELEAGCQTLDVFAVPWSMAEKALIGKYRELKQNEAIQDVLDHRVRQSVDLDEVKFSLEQGRKSVESKWTTLVGKLIDPGKSVNSSTESSPAAVSNRNPTRCFSRKTTLSWILFSKS